MCEGGKGGAYGACKRRPNWSQPLVQMPDKTGMVLRDEFTKKEGRAWSFRPRKSSSVSYLHHKTIILLIYERGKAIEGAGVSKRPK